MTSISIKRTIMCLAVLSVAGAHVALGDDKIKELMRSTGHIELKLYGAHVPDLDRLPMQGDSDVFARVFLNDTKEMLCETSVVQDDNSPKFDKECGTKKPVHADTVVKIELFDSDKPSPDPDWIGVSKIKVSDLILQRRLDSKEMFPIEGREFPKHNVKVKINFRPEK